jgi:hypothetical protein
MSDEHATARYRQWYRRLLRCYSRPHRERFGESMEQTFHDLCRERAEAGEPLGGFVLRTFAETSASILRENGRVIMLQNRFVRIALIVGLIMLLPLTGNMFVEGFNWSPFDFAVWGGILFAAGIIFDVVSRKGRSFSYRAAVGIACLAGFLSFWVNAAVGVIGNDDAVWLGAGRRSRLPVPAARHVADSVRDGRGSSDRPGHRARLGSRGRLLAGRGEGDAAEFILGGDVGRGGSAFQIC